LPISTRLFETLSSERSQFLIFISISLAMTVLLAVLSFLGYPPLLLRLFVGINPLIVVLLVSFLGFFLFAFLISKGYFAIYKKGHLKGYLYASGLAALLGLIAIIVDFSTRIYSADINVLFPKSLLFYPAMGYFAEILFQLLPLTIVLIVLSPLSERISSNKTVWGGIFVASLPEPVFQTLGVSGQLPLWFAVIELVRIFFIILSQLTFFKRYDFVTMYWFRIVYYITWHIVWGYLRLILLF
jgi:hypothetical protein